MLQRRIFYLELEITFQPENFRKENDGSDYSILCPFKPSVFNVVVCYCLERFLRLPRHIGIGDSLFADDVDELG